MFSSIAWYEKVFDVTYRLEAPHLGGAGKVLMDDARQLINALAGLLAAARGELGDKWEPLYAGLRTVQEAFREAAAHPDAPGEGPGEQLLS